MKIEHAAYNVQDPRAMAKWYVENLGFTVKVGMDTPPFGHFLVDGSGAVMIELYRNETVPVLDYPSIDPLQLHLAFISEDVPADLARLLAAGASPEQEPTETPGGDVVAMCRDPWGLAIQLVCRATPMV